MSRRVGENQRDRSVAVVDIQRDVATPVAVALEMPGAMTASRRVRRRVGDIVLFC